jgi:diguanylate cyclase (GGDEF)-like protein
MRIKNRKLVFFCLSVYTMSLFIYIVTSLVGYYENSILTSILGGLIFSLTIPIIGFFISSYYKKLLFHDHLTEIGNRKKLFENMGRLLSRKDEFSVVYLDFNGFKKINDTHGHHIGDEVLMLFSENVKEIENNWLTSYRIGGDEFVFIITKDFNTNLEKIMSLKRTKNPITNENINFEIGVAHSNNKMSADDLIRLADKNMYESKRKNKKTTKQENKSDNL